MIPMFYSFLKKDLEQVFWYRRFFEEFASRHTTPTDSNLNELTILQFLFWGSWYLALEKQQFRFANEKLETLIFRYLSYVWNSPAWEWPECGMSSFPTMKERLDYKLSREITSSISYCKGIVDHELFAFGIAGNLWFLGNNNPPIPEILDYAKRTVDTYVEFTNTGGMIFQKGAWTDHYESKYACYENLPLPENPEPCPDLTWDSSHAIRFPLVFLSLYRAQRSPEERKLYLNLLHHLENQFLKVVLVSPDGSFQGYRTRNFIVGRNGFYRVGYPTTPDGYGPYELSGSSLLFGFWSLLPSKEIHQVYSFLYKNFDSFDNEKELYKKASYTQRERNEIYVNAF
jgi:hypothetical protein